MSKIASTNPAQNYKKIGEVKVSTNTEIKKAVEEANKVKRAWKDTSLKERIKLLRATEKLFKKHSDEIAESITKEVGTAITECKGEVNWNWSYWDWFLENAEKALASETTYEDKKMIHQVVYEPIGTAAVITPWNLPFDLFVWGVIPNLLAGNTVVYKASEECILTGKLISKIMEQSPLPKGVFQAIHGDARQGSMLVNQDIDLIWFTGSSEVGKKLYELAGKKFIKVVLEMGGSNPVIVFADADLEKAAAAIAVKRLMFAGQTCDADKRLIVEKAAEKELTQKLKEKIEVKVVGDPEKTNTQMGPLAAKRQLTLLKAQLKEALDMGAKIAAQAKLESTLKGAYFPPTLLSNVKPTMRVWWEEVFGPILPMMTFKTEVEAVALANDTEFGLGSQVFTKDLKKAQRVALKIEAGNVDINGVGHFKPMSPFGGYKQSGIGREHGIHGLRELTQIKVVTRNK